MESLAQASHFLRCENCWGTFRNQDFILPENEEAERYESHENNLEDERYRSYLTSSIEPFLKCIEKADKGLDYGCGPSLSFEGILKPKGYHLQSYDKYFLDNPKVFNQTYDFIILHEVIEHFVDFKAEFEKILTLLNPGGQVFIRTELCPDTEEGFENWYYKNDSTHVFFLTEETFKFLAQEYDLQFTKLDANKFILQKQK